MALQREMTKLMLERRGITGSIVNHEAYFTIANKILAYFVQHTKVTNETIKTILSLLDGIKLVVIVYAKSITPEAKNAISTNIVRFETFTFDEMSFDLIKIVPHHEKIAKPCHEWTKFPVILSSDIVARYYGFCRNDAIKIVDGDEICYRRCV